MMHSRGANTSDAELVWTQIILGLGGGLATVSAQVGAQAAVPHIITAIVVLLTQIGGPVGSTCAGANTMPGSLEGYP